MGLWVPVSEIEAEGSRFQGFRAFKTNAQRVNKHTVWIVP